MTGRPDRRLLQMFYALCEVTMCLLWANVVPLSLNELNRNTAFVLIIGNTPKSDSTPTSPVLSNLILARQGSYHQGLY